MTSNKRPTYIEKLLAERDSLINKLAVKQTELIDKVSQLEKEKVDLEHKIVLLQLTLDSFHWFNKSKEKE